MGFASRLREDFRSMSVMFGGCRRLGLEWRRGSLWRVLRNPITLVCAAAFALAIGLSAVATARVSRRSAEERLLKAAGDMRVTISDCVDDILFFEGERIVGLFARPEAVPPSAVGELKLRYGLDELNVVNSNGIVVAASERADLGFDMGSRPEPAEFNCLLGERRRFSQPFRRSACDPSRRRKYVGVAFPERGSGYIQMGFDESRLVSGLDSWFEDAAVGWHIGERGYYVIGSDETGEIQSCGRLNPDGTPSLRPGDTFASIGFDASAAPADPGRFFRARLFGERCLCLTETVCFHRVIAAIPLAEIGDDGMRLVAVTGAILFVVFVLVVFFMTRLADLVASLREFISRDRENREKDLAVSRTIQLSSLPVVFPDTPEFAMSARMWPAREVGGDFYDFFRLPSGRTAFLVADVSGKGIPAALFMMKAKAIFRACAAGAGDLAEAVAETNRRLCENNDAMMFVTAWAGGFDPATGRVDYVCAGHNPPLVKRADGRVEWLRNRPAMAMATVETARYRVESCQLGPGDEIVLYTDGVTEAMNPRQEQYGEERLEADLREAAAGADLVGVIREKVSAFVEGAEPSDDLTVLVLRRKP